MNRISEFIVKYRKIILLVATLLLIPSIFGYLNTGVNYDILTYLPESSESIQAQDVLNDDFNLAGTAMVIMDDADDKDVAAMKSQIEQIEGVEHVLWRDSIAPTEIPARVLPDALKNALYSQDATMIVVTFSEPAASDTTMNAIEQIKAISDDNTHVAGFSAITADTKAMIDKETPIYSAIAVLLCLVVLCMGLRSWLAPVIFLLGMVYPIIYNMGTNIFFGQISFVTKALSMILLLAVSMDYSIFLLHRYQEEKSKNESKEQAMANAITSTFLSISSSSVTTIAGFLALVVMQLTLGRDIGLVMAKGVILAVVSTILILPSLLMFFDKWIEKWQHPVLIKAYPQFSDWVINHRKAMIAILLILFIPAMYCQANAPQYYDLAASLPDEMNSVVGNNELKDKFDMTTAHFVMVDENLDSRDKEQLISRLEDVDGVSGVIAYEKFAGPELPARMEPEVLSDFLNKGGRELILVNSTYRSATDELSNQLTEMKDILKDYDENAMIAGEGALNDDLIAVTNVDFQMVNIVSIILILLIIAVTFKSFSLPLILVMCIEFAIFINMGIPFLTGTKLPFIAGIVIGTIQLGACIDYAILLTSRFKEELANGETPKKAITTAITMSAPSIMTSGLSFFAACSGVSLIAKMDLIQSLCTLLGRGALISVVVILTILPSLLYTCNTFIAKTTKGWPKAVTSQEAELNKKEKQMKGEYQHA